METAVVISLVCGFFAWLYISDKNETAEREARARQAVEEADRKKREREAWLRTPEGLAWQQSELEKAQRQTEEKERLQKLAFEQQQRAKELAARAQWQSHHEHKSMHDISQMTGVQFEAFLARLYAAMGYANIQRTPMSNDFGADLVCTDTAGNKIAIQAKRWASQVGNDAVQEILGALSYYGCAQGLVVTNSTFTRNAQQLASKDPRVTLLDKSWLEKQIIKYFPPEIPEFNWDEFRDLTRAIQAKPTAGASSTSTGSSYHRKHHGSRRRYR